ncbi:uncharacterized protein OCT59_012394 [Rhizophagus irregularis]|uniref:uncharacterized protein n=1 Tax=Rhizophagus irregularis TaxID=588596 RepID=UPI0033215702|nr:hypothetical protein OCT59_012394 [Rhizophagus irregularis]
MSKKNKKNEGKQNEKNDNFSKLIKELLKKIAELKSTVDTIKEQNAELNSTVDTIKEQNAELNSTVDTIKEQNAIILKSIKIKNNEKKEKSTNTNINKKKRQAKSRKESKEPIVLSIEQQSIVDLLNNNKIAHNAEVLISKYPGYLQNLQSHEQPLDPNTKTKGLNGYMLFRLFCQKEIRAFLEVEKLVNESQVASSYIHKVWYEIYTQHNRNLFFALEKPRRNEEINFAVQISNNTTTIEPIVVDSDDDEKIENSHELGSTNESQDNETSSKRRCDENEETLGPLPSPKRSKKSISINALID